MVIEVETIDLRWKLGLNQVRTQISSRVLSVWPSRRPTPGSTLRSFLVAQRTRRPTAPRRRLGASACAVLGPRTARSRSPSVSPAAAASRYGTAAAVATRTAIAARCNAAAATRAIKARRAAGRARHIPDNAIATRRFVSSLSTSRSRSSSLAPLHRYAFFRPEDPRLPIVLGTTGIESTHVFERRGPSN